MIKWAALIKNRTQDAVDDIILERCSDKFMKKYSKYLSKIKKSRMPQALCKIAVFPSSFYWLLKGKIKKIIRILKSDLTLSKNC